MPAYRVELLDRQVRKQLDRIHEPDFSRVAAAILGLESDPRPPGCRKLRGVEGCTNQRMANRRMANVDRAE